jgi:hypothetical protein
MAIIYDLFTGKVLSEGSDEMEKPVYSEQPNTKEEDLLVNNILGLHIISMPNRNMRCKNCKTLNEVKLVNLE